MRDLMRTKFIRLFRKALATLLKEGPVTFIKKVLRTLYARRKPLTTLFRTILSTMLKKLLHEGPVGCARYNALLFKKVKYRLACKRKAAEYAGSEINLAHLKPNSAGTPPQNEDLSHFSVLFVTAIDVQAS